MAPDAVVGTQGLDAVIGATRSLGAPTEVVPVEEEDASVLAHLNQEIGVFGRTEVLRRQGQRTAGPRSWSPWSSVGALAGAK